MSKKIVIANWKMNPISEKEAERLFINVAKLLSKIKKTEIVVCAPFVYLNKFKKFVKKIKLGAQNVSSEESGAYTGEISTKMLYDLGVRYVILGHSERRNMGEKDEEINKKIKISLASGLVPILCVGEKERDKNHEYLKLVENQIKESLKGISKNLISKIIIAYEPVWAIGKNATREATPAEFLEMKIFIKKIFSGIFGVKIKIPSIIYGGSVNEKNAEEFLRQGEADGFLVGRISLEAEKFYKIISITESNF